MGERARRQLRQLWTGLVVYGVVGIGLTVVLLGAVGLITGRLDDLSDRLSTRLDTISQTVAKTAITLDRAGETSQGFATTLDQAVPTLGQVDTSLGEVVITLKDLETTTANLTVFGQRPFAALSERFGRIAGQLEALQAQIRVLGANLGANGTNLAALGTSLADLGTQLRAIDAVIGSGELQSSLADIVSAIRLALALLAVWFAVPAVGALVLGLWIRRQLDDEELRPEAQPG